MKRWLFLFAVAWAILPLATPARAANWATSVVDYSPGATYPPPDPHAPYVPPPTGAVNASYTTVTSGTTPILDGITADTGAGTPYPSVLTPFNGAYQPADILGIGQFGSITLQFATPVRTNGHTIGIHTGAGLIDIVDAGGSDNAGTTPTVYTAPRRATVAVRAADTDWFTLGTFDLDNPSNYYAAGVDSPGYQVSVTGGTPADVEKPFLGNLASFSGQTWPQMLATLDGSAGGNWLDLSFTGLPSVSFIRFTVPTGSVLYLDGVVGLPVPEPSSLAVLALGVMGLAFRRRKNSYVVRP